MKKLNALITMSVLAVSLLNFNTAAYADDDDDYRYHRDQQNYENIISAEKAKEIAFEHAGVNENRAYLEELELDGDDGRLVYEVEFQAGRYEYEYDIDARTGRILKYDRDHDDRFDD